MRCAGAMAQRSLASAGAARARLQRAQPLFQLRHLAIHHVDDPVDVGLFLLGECLGHRLFEETAQDRAPLDELLQSQRQQFGLGVGHRGNLTCSTAAAGKKKAA